MAFITACMQKQWSVCAPRRCKYSTSFCFPSIICDNRVIFSTERFSGKSIIFVIFIKVHHNQYMVHYDDTFEPM